MKRPRVALTHSAGRLDDLAALLEERGFEVVRSPLVETVPRTDERTAAAAATLMSLPWLLITSRSTVEAIEELGGFAEGPLIGAVGPATAAALQEVGAMVTFVATPNNARGLAHAFLAHPLARGPVGLPRGNRALETLEQELGEAGFATRPLVVYDTRPQPWRGDGADALVLASPSAVEALPTEVGSRSRLVTLGETTSAAVRSRGWRCEEAQEPTAQATLAALERVLA
ncbi:MAG TPA: uroporphyrinogen-III synthase [Trueperaceae bacterium]